jgi:hypothetical protein
MRGVERDRAPEGLFDHGPRWRVSPARRLRERRLRRRRRAVGALLILAVGGAAAWFAFSSGNPPPGGSEPAPERAATSGRLRPAVLAALDRTAVAWMPGGFPLGFGPGITDVEGVAHATPVMSGVAWLTEALDGGGVAVRGPPGGTAYPIEVAAADPTAFVRFLPPSRRELADDLAGGEGILGRTAARIRAVGPGGRLGFGGVTVGVAAVLPDELLSGHELLVSREMGAALGLTLDRFALVRPAEGADLSGIRDGIVAGLEPGTYVEVRGWSPQVPYLRHGDGMSSMAELKAAFGEFAADPEGGELEPDERWKAANLVTREVPLLGSVTCHRRLMPQLVGALEELAATGDGPEAVGSGYEGCYVPRFINRDPTRALSYHSWGVAIDVNAERNPFGAPPDQDPRLVEVMERWGFSWGGRWEVPDGMHFEWAWFPS